MLLTPENAVTRTIISLILAAPIPGAAVTLNFNSLPSAQGWTYSTSGPAEGSIFSADGTTLHQYSMGTGIGAGGTAFQYYVLNNAVNTISPFTMQVTARILDSETGDLGGFIFSALTGTQNFLIAIDRTTIWGSGVSGPTVLSTSIDSTTYHVYRLDGTPGGGYRFFVDEILIATGVPENGAFPNQLALGDATSGGNARADVTSFSYQAVPEPSGFVLMSLALAIGGAAARKRRSVEHEKAGSGSSSLSTGPGAPVWQQGESGVSGFVARSPATSRAFCSRQPSRPASTVDRGIQCGNLR